MTFAKNKHYIRERGVKRVEYNIGHRPDKISVQIENVLVN